jgi:hypothetical protein
LTVSWHLDQVNQAMAEVEQGQAKARPGHSSLVITQTIYQRILPGMGEDAGAQLTRLLSQR